MLKRIFKRLLLSLLIVWGVLSITFLIIHLSPGDPSSLYLKPEIDQKTVEHIRQQMGLDRPLVQQYFSWIWSFAQGNFGVSFMQKRPVKDILVEAIPNTLQLTTVVFILQMLIGTVLGVLSAVKRNTRIDFSLSTFLIFLYSMPGFWLALMLITLFSLKLGWLPSSQMQSFVVNEDFWSIMFDRIKHLILPAAVLTAPFAAYTARFVRTSLTDVLEQDYIRTAMAYGLNYKKILFKYALRNALLPLTTLVGLYLPFLLGGAVVTEYIFAWPGIGRITVNAIFAHDFPVILASNFIAALTVVVGNQISDLLYVFVDPRIKLQL